MFTTIMEIFALIAHLLTTVVRVALPGGVRAVIAESLLLKHQLLILNRSRNRAPRLTPWDRLLFGVGAFLVAPNLCSAIIRRGRESVDHELALEPVWHDWTLLSVAAILIQLVAETLRWGRLAFRSSRSIKAENLFLRRQLALYIERGVKPRRIDPVTRIALTLLSRFFNWRDALVVVRPKTMMRWHRAGWRLFWRLKSRPGRPPIPLEIQALIRRMARENPAWGEQRIANEFLVKLGIRLSPRTVSKYLSRRPPGRPRGDLRWATFLRLHAQGIIACDY